MGGRFAMAAAMMAILAACVLGAALALATPSTAQMSCPPADTHAYILKLSAGQGHRWILNPFKHMKDAAGRTEFEIPVPRAYYEQVRVGEELKNEFRWGAAVMRGSISSNVIEVIGKRSEPL